MPIYEYDCTNCHQTFNVLEKMSDEPRRTCKHCQQETAVRLVSAAAFHLKGTGWYATDFRDKDKGPKEKTSAEKTTETAKDKAPADKPVEPAKAKVEEKAKDGA